MTRTCEKSWGAHVRDGGVLYRLWAPAAKRVATVVFSGGERTVPMQPVGDGWYECFDAASRAGTRYLYEIDGKERVADPAARFAPEGPRAPCEVIDPSAFGTREASRVVRAFAEMVFYELHVGTFTADRTYAAAAEHLDELADLGVTAIELMPLAERPGTFNWGYDGVLLYAPAHSYGRPEDLHRFIDAAHERGLCVFLDVVYNHFGPQDNYIRSYAPQFFTRKHATPWGEAIDYSSPGNEPVRRFIVENAAYWICEYGFDGLRLDAAQAIYDEGPTHVLDELAAEVRRQAGRPVYLVLENDNNDAGLLRSSYDAQWNDDVHHCLHVLLTGEGDGYYQDYVDDPIRFLGRALTQGFAYQGEASPFRDGRMRGTPSSGLILTHFVNCLQNHDQIGNRALGERITTLAPAEAVRAATAVLLLAPSPPLLFMGEEWASSAPFLFFADFEPGLARLVREGRRNEFARFARFADPALREAIPDPAAPQTVSRSTLDWDERTRGVHAEWLALHRTLLQLRQREIVPRIAKATGERARYQVRGPRGLYATWQLDDGATLILETNLGARPQRDFAASAPGRNLYATHETFADGTAPPWSVRWSIA